MIGMGAANVASYRLLLRAGADPAGIVGCDSQGTLHPGRSDIERQQVMFPDKWCICRETNGDGVTGGIPEALRGADVCLAFSRPGPHVIRPEWIQAMAPKPIVFACANPVPEVWPDQAREGGAMIVATGRSDFPNQVNNSLVFPGIFRGTLDVRARTITDEMALAAARELAAAAAETGLSELRIVPRMSEWHVYPRIAAATGAQAIDQGVARIQTTRDELFQHALKIISQARKMS